MHSYLPFFLFILLASCSLAQAPPCPAGSYLGGAVCRLCPSGTYSDRQNTPRCTPCRAGTYNPFRGAQGSDVCRRCPRNTSSTTPAATSLAACTACAPGLVSDGFTFPCRTCPPGTATPGSADVCVKCEPGEYQEENECKKCPVGTASLEGSAGIGSCTPCVPPTVLRFARRCEACSPGSAYIAAMRECRRCPSGSSGDGGAQACVPCPSGTEARGNGASACVPCKDGFVARGPGVSVCRREGAACPPGAYVTKNEDCLLCGTGEQVDVDTETCRICAPGTVSEGGALTRCTLCPPGTVVSNDGASCLCENGRERVGDDCVKCAPGSFKVLRDFEDFERPCLKCPGGMFSRSPGASECETCAEGNVSEEGSTRCQECPRGLVVSGLRQFEIPDRCVVPSTNCPPGFSRARARFGGTICRADSCPIDSFHRRDGRCERCEPGEVPNTQRGCQPCRSTSTSKGGVARCERCADGFVRSEEDGTKCVCEGSLARGRGLVGLRCAKCKPGTFNTGEGAGEATCTKCTPGTAVRFPGADTCFACRENEFADVSGLAMCKSCPPGTGSYGLGDVECFAL